MCIEKVNKIKEKFNNIRDKFNIKLDDINLKLNDIKRVMKKKKSDTIEEVNGMDRVQLNKALGWFCENVRIRNSTKRYKNVKKRSEN